MADNAVRRLIEVIGLISVVGSLIFVGVEVRQNSISTRSATNAALTNTYVEVNLTVASSPDLADVFERVAEDPEAASPGDSFRLLALWRSLLHTWSNAHRQHLNGTLDPALYQAMVQEVSAYARGASTDESNEELENRARVMRWAWERERYIFNPDFQSFVDGMVAFEH